MTLKAEAVSEAALCKVKTTTTLFSICTSIVILLSPFPSWPHSPCIQQVCRAACAHPVQTLAHIKQVTPHGNLHEPLHGEAAFKVFIFLSNFMENFKTGQGCNLAK